MVSFRSQDFKGMFAGLMGYSFFAVADMLFKLLGSEHSVYLMAFWSSFSTLTLALVVSALQGDLKMCVLPDKPWLKLLRGILITIHFFCFFSALTTFDIDMEKAYAISFCVPFVITILALIVFKDRTVMHHWVCVVVGFVGVLFVVRPGLVEFEFGVALLFCSVVLLSVTNLMVRVVKTERDTGISLILYTVVPSMVMSLAAVLYLGGVDALYVPEIKDFLLILAAGAISFVGLLGLVHGYAIARANMVAPTNYIQMLWAILFGMFIFDSQPDKFVFIGAAIVIASGLFLVWGESRDKGDQVEELIEEEFSK